LVNDKNTKKLKNNGCFFFVIIKTILRTTTGIETRTVHGWARQPVYKKTGSETGFLAQNLERLLDRDFQGGISDSKADQIFKTWTGLQDRTLDRFVKQDRDPVLLK
jgi:hypothetical protein